MIVNVHEAKTHFSRLLVRVAAGEEIIIGKAGRPVARLVPYRKEGHARRPGGWEGRVRMAEDFEDLPDELMTPFRGL